MLRAAAEGIVLLTVERLVVEELHRRIGEDVGDARRFWKQRVLGAAIFDGRGERAERDLVIVRDARRVRDHRFLAQCGKLTWNG